MYAMYMYPDTRAHTRLYTRAGPDADHFERLSDCAAAPATPSASAYRQTSTASSSFRALAPLPLAPTQASPYAVLVVRNETSTLSSAQTVGADRTPIQSNGQS